MHHCVRGQHGNHSFFFLQVHNLDPNTWKSVEVVHIDIADRTQVEPGVSKCSAIGRWVQHAANAIDASHSALICIHYAFREACWKGDVMCESILCSILWLSRGSFPTVPCSVTPEQSLTDSGGHFWDHKLCMVLFSCLGVAGWRCWFDFVVITCWRGERTS